MHYLAVSDLARRHVVDEIRGSFHSLDDVRPGRKLSSCRVLEAAIDEALRLAPPTPGCFWRHLKRDTMIDGHLVPAGCEVGVCQFALHRVPEYFPQPDRYSPDRFLASSSPPSVLSAFNPFGMGSRSCPAQSFARRSVKVFIARIVWSTDFEPTCRAGTLPSHQDHLDADTPPYILKDCFSAEKEGPELRFRARTQEAVVEGET